MAAIGIASGSTPQGSTAWQQYTGGAGVYVDVNTTTAGFTGTPLYFTSLGGASSHWATTGATSIYLPTATGFRVYVRWVDGLPLTPATANAHGWHINWLAIRP